MNIFKLKNFEEILPFTNFQKIIFLTKIDRYVRNEERLRRRSWHAWLILSSGQNGRFCIYDFFFLADFIDVLFDRLECVE